MKKIIALFVVFSITSLYTGLYAKEKHGADHIVHKRDCQQDFSLVSLSGNFLVKEQGNYFITEKGKYCSLLLSFNEPLLAESLKIKSDAESGKLNWGNNILKILGGSAVGLGLGIAGANAAESVLDDPSWECPDCPGNVRSGEGFLVGAAIGSSIAVYGIGRALGEKGKFGATLIGGMLPAVAGILIAELGKGGHSGNTCFLFGVLTPVTATIAFNQSKKKANKEQEKSLDGLINIRERRLCITFPRMLLGPNRLTVTIFSF